MTESSENNIIDYLISTKETPFYTIRQKIRPKKEPIHLEIITPNNYHIIYKNNYTVHEIKTQLKNNKLKLSGNKSELLDRLYQYFKSYKFVVLIQKFIRGYLQRKLISLRGIGFKKRDLCINKEDFLTMETMTQINTNQFFSYTASDNTTYGFNILSIYNIITKVKGHPQNPYNREKIPNNIIQNIYEIIKIGKVLKQPIEICIPSTNDNIMSDTKRVEMRALDIFQNINLLGNYSDSIWFLSLSRNQLFKLYGELFDIWNYRANLTDDIRFKICRPHGNPFISDRLNYYTDNNIHQIQNKLLNIFEKMTNTGIDVDSKVLGAYYILAALTLVSANAAEAMHWLYQSVSYNHH